MSDLEGDELVQESQTFEDWQPASPLKRVIAFFLDGSIVLILLLVVLSTGKIDTTWPAKTYLWAILMWAWEGMWLTFWGRTPGRFFLGLAIYSPHDDAPPTPLQVCVRILAFWTTAPLMGLGLTPILYRQDRSGWHDQLSETVTVTNEPKGSYPNPSWRRIGHAFILIQSLVVFAAGGAALLTRGLQLVQTEDKSLQQLTCDNSKLVYQNPHEFLTALLVSPSWNVCWLQMRPPLEIFAGSQYIKVVDAVHKAYLISLYQPQLRPALFRKELAPLAQEICANKESTKECQTVRLLANLLNVGIESPPGPDNWLNQHESFLRQFFSARNQEQRVRALQAFSQKKNLTPLLTVALAERLWSEGLAARPDLIDVSPPFSPRSDWLQQQICWREAFTLPEDDLCQKNPYRYGVQFIKRLDSGTLSAEDAENFLGDNRQLDEDVEQAIQIWIAVEKKNTAAAIKGWRETRIIDPLYPYVDRWYQSLKQ